MPRRSQVLIAIFKTQGMSTPGRTQKLRLELSKLEGIRAIDINYIMDTVSIRYNSKKLTPEEIRNTIGGASAWPTT